MEKRGQVTLFIIVAIVIVAGIFIFSVTKSKVSSTEGEIITDEEIRRVYDFIKFCIEETGYEALYEIGQNGGYYLLPEKMTTNGIPIYYDKGQDYSPTVGEIEEQISLYVNNNLANCFLDFSEFPEYEVQGRRITATTDINKDKVIVDVSYRVGIQKGNSSMIFTEFNDNVIPIRLGLIHVVVKELTNLQFNDPNNLCLGCFVDIGDRENLTISHSNYEGDVIIFQITDLQSEEERQPYQFIFASRFDIT